VTTTSMKWKGSYDSDRKSRNKWDITYVWFAESCRCFSMQIVAPLLNPECAI